MTTPTAPLTAESEALLRDWRYDIVDGLTLNQLQDRLAAIEAAARAPLEARIAELEAALAKADIVAASVGFLLSVIASREGLGPSEEIAERENLREYQRARAALAQPAPAEEAPRTFVGVFPEPAPSEEVG
jgi:hypothetical protein